MKPWEKISYQNIRSATIMEDFLIVTFENEDVVKLNLQSLLPSVSQRLLKTIPNEDLNFTSYEVAITIEGEAKSIPWDKIRVLSDKEFGRFLADKAEEQAKLI